MNRKQLFGATVLLLPIVIGMTLTVLLAPPPPEESRVVEEIDLTVYVDDTSSPVVDTVRSYAEKHHLAWSVQDASAPDNKAALEASDVSTLPAIRVRKVYRSGDGKWLATIQTHATGTVNERELHDTVRNIRAARTTVR